MAQLRVRIELQGGYRAYEVKMPDDELVKDLIPQLVEALELPTMLKDGSLPYYVLVREATKEFLQEDTTLSQAKVSEGETLRLFHMPNCS